MDRERVRLSHIDDCRKLGQGKWEIRLGYIKRKGVEFRRVSRIR